MLSLVGAAIVSFSIATFNNDPAAASILIGAGLWILVNGALITAFEFYIVEKGYRE